MIIGISGKKGHGKDLVASIIMYLDALKKDNTIGDFEYWYSSNLYTIYADNSRGFKIKRFADKLKDMVCLLIGCTREQLEDREFKEKELGEEWWRYKQHDGSVYRYISKESYNSLPENVKNSNDCFIKKLTPRKLLQLLGTECGRNIIHPNIWVNALFSEYSKLITVKGKGIRTECHKETGRYIIPTGHGEHTGKIIPVQDFEYIIATPIKPNWIIPDVRFKNETERILAEGGVNIRIERPMAQTDEFVIEHESETALDNYNGFQHRIINDGSIDDLIQNLKPVVKEIFNHVN